MPRRVAVAAGALRLVHRVVGTGDLSEIALGWSTYGVGDQMSHYAVNAGVPKTLIQYLIRWAVKTHQFDAETDRSDIFAMAPNGDNQKVLIDGIRNESEPDVSPNGRSIVFASNRFHESNIYVAKAKALLG